MKNNDCLEGELKALYDKWSAEINADPYMSQLTQVYEKWLNELRSAHSYLLEDKKYSNPYYLYVPNEWATAKNKIMIIGEEGYGNWGCGKKCGWIKNTPAWTPDSFNDIRLYHRDLILSQTKYRDLLSKREDGSDLVNTDEYIEFAKWFNSLYKRKPFNSDFWRRIYAIYSVDKNNGAIIWNNLDKVFSLRGDNDRCALKHTDRVNLHSVKTKLLEEEIKITQPTIVIFNGWYGTSIKAELKHIYDKFYEDAPLEEWKENKVCAVTDDTYGGTVKYICAYHPAFRPNTLNGKFGNNKTEYEKFLIQKIEGLL